MTGRRTHGHTSGPAGSRRTSRTYNTWIAMVQRCTYPKHEKYPQYGGRGIKLDPRWRVFENFLADMGERPMGKTLDRRDTNGDYTLSNCRWATVKPEKSELGVTKLPAAQPLVLVLSCPNCGQPHVDEGEWAKQLHWIHKCVEPGCGFEWQPALVPTIGVERS